MPDAMDDALPPDQRPDPLEAQERSEAARHTLKRQQTVELAHDTHRHPRCHCDSSCSCNGADADEPLGAEQEATASSARESSPCGAANSTAHNDGGEDHAAPVEAVGSGDEVNPGRQSDLIDKTHSVPPPPFSSPPCSPPSSPASASSSTSSSCSSSPSSGPGNSGVPSKCASSGLACGSSSVSSQATAPPCPPASSQAAGSAPASPCPCVVVCGGFDGLRPYDTVLKFLFSSPKSAARAGADLEVQAVEETSLPPLSTARYGHHLCVAGADLSLLVIIGGRNARGAVLPTVEVLDLPSRRWAALPSLHFPRCHIAACSIPGGGVAVLGGEGEKGALKNVEVYDPIRKAWKTLPPMAENRHSAAAACIGSSIYCLGGRDEAGCHGRILRSGEILEVQQQQPSASGRRGSNAATVAVPWRRLPPMLQARTGLAAVALDGKLYAVGGTNGVKPLACVEIFDPQTSQWTSGKSRASPLAPAAPPAARRTLPSNLERRRRFMWGKENSAFSQWYSAPRRCHATRK
eukprot:GHVT01095888.1.p1 GENE.GHVT01095888.1~~GHVT01095888.1.p1  ORF type:complete len:521 (+),score=151.04 GHVT01095888.1:820-2382(+)